MFDGSSRKIGGEYGFFISAPQPQRGFCLPVADSLITLTSQRQVGFVHL